MEFSERKLLILQAIIDDYILTGIPVGSRTLSKHDELSFSSATIRNEMADLEDYGYLSQPHTSAGRMPTDKAYRLYVDMLMHSYDLKPKEISQIKKYYNEKIDQMEQVISTTAKVLSDTTMLTSMVMAPQLAQMKISRIQIVRLTGRRALLLLVFENGTVKDMMITAGEELEPSFLDMLSNMLTEHVRGLTLKDAHTELVKGAAGELYGHKELIMSMLDTLKRSADSEDAKKMVLGGAQNIFNHPEYQDVERAKSFLKLLETKEPLYDMLSQATDMEFSIKIGRENDIEELKDMSVVTATYKAGKDKLGSFGVIGPIRMNYAKVLSVLSCVGASMSEILKYFIMSDDKED